MSFLKKLLFYLRLLIEHLIHRRYHHFLYEISLKLPNWLFMYNKATILIAPASKLEIPGELKKDIKVRTANYNDIHHISRISGWELGRIKTLLDHKGVCFLASLCDSKPSSLTWLAFGKCYVRGVGFKFEVPPNDIYGVGTFTLPEFRGKGLYLGLNRAIINYAFQRDIDNYHIIIELTNEYSLRLRKKMGFRITGHIKYFKFLFIRICRIKYIEREKPETRIFLREPKKEVVII